LPARKAGRRVARARLPRAAAIGSARERNRRACRGRTAPESAGARRSRCGFSPPQYLRSEEHTSELQSHLNLVCRVLLEKKNKMSARRIDGKGILKVVWWPGKKHTKHIIMRG